MPVTVEPWATDHKEDQGADGSRVSSTVYGTLKLTSTTKLSLGNKPVVWNLQP